MALFGKAAITFGASFQILACVQSHMQFKCTSISQRLIAQFTLNTSVYGFWNVRIALVRTRFIVDDIKIQVRRFVILLFFVTLNFFLVPFTSIP